ncbi:MULTISPECIES: hypothetical protein [Cytobacillus]|uniref:hypothetical protein n=1 Tax=Cytobacillus TaxID=2675230 RepID=UPI001416FDAE|nr:MULTISPECIES: hypothetical protein [Cytobacillus]
MKWRIFGLMAHLQVLLTHFIGERRNHDAEQHNDPPKQRNQQQQRRIKFSHKKAAGRASRFHSYFCPV